MKDEMNDGEGHELRVFKKASGLSILKEKVGGRSREAERQQMVKEVNGPAFRDLESL